MKALNSDIIKNIKKELSGKQVDWGVFAGSACYIYGSERNPTDIDILIRNHDLEKAAIIFDQKPKTWINDIVKETVAKISIGNLEMCCDIRANISGKKYNFFMDDVMVNRIRIMEFLGIDVPVISPEDNIVLKSILQRGQDMQKYDIPDVIAVWRKQNIDIRYLKHRAKICNAEERVFQLLTKLQLLKEKTNASARKS